MRINKVLVFQDENRGILGVSFDNIKKEGTEKVLFTFTDIMRSKFLWDIVSEFFDISIEAAEKDGVVLFYPIQDSMPSLDSITIITMKDISIMAGKFPVELSKKFAGINIKAENEASSGLTKGELVSEVSKIYDMITESLAGYVSDIIACKVLQNDSDYDLLCQGAKDSDYVAKYFAAMELDRVMNNEYDTSYKDQIEESSLVMPYNQKFKSRAVDGVIRKHTRVETTSGLTPESFIDVLGPKVLLSLPKYSAFLRYYNSVSMEESDAADTDYEQEEPEDDSGVDSEEILTDEDGVELTSQNTHSDSETTDLFGNGNSGNSGADAVEKQVKLTGVLNIKVNAFARSSEEIENFKELLAYKIDKVPDSEKNEAFKSTTMYRPVPVAKEVYNDITAKVPFYDCYYYKQAYADSANVQNTPISYVCGSEAANKVGLLPRELYWFDRFQSIVQDALMAERHVFTVEEIHKLLKEGERPRCVNAVLREVIKSVLIVTRSFTGRTPMDRSKIRDTSSSSSEDDDNDMYQSYRGCFYTVTNGKRVDSTEPTEMGLTSGMYKNLESSLDRFITNYARSSYVLGETLLHLLRGGIFKQSFLAMECTSRETSTGPEPMYFDINTASISTTMGNIESFVPYEEQSLIFSIRAIDAGYKREFEKAVTETLTTPVLNGVKQYQNGYVVGVGLWSAFKEQKSSKTDFLDIITFVNYYRKQLSLGTCKLNVEGIAYDSDTNRFSWEIEGKEDVISALTMDALKMQVGTLTLRDATDGDSAKAEEERLNLFSDTTQIGGVKEYRSVIESLELTAIKSHVARVASDQTLTRPQPWMSPFVQIQWLMKNVGQLDVIYDRYKTFRPMTQLPANMKSAVTSFLKAALIMEYYLKFLRLFSYCSEKGIDPHGDFIEYLNTVNDFLTEDEGYIPGIAEKVVEFKSETVLEETTTWHRVVANLEGKVRIFCYAGELTDSRVVIIENTPTNAELIAEVKKKMAEPDKLGPNWNFKSVYTTIVLKFKGSLNKKLFLPNGAASLKQLDMWNKTL